MVIQPATFGSLRSREALKQGDTPKSISFCFILVKFYPHRKGILQFEPFKLVWRLTWALLNVNAKPWFVVQMLLYDLADNMLIRPKPWSYSPQRFILRRVPKSIDSFLCFISPKKLRCRHEAYSVYSHFPKKPWVLKIACDLFSQEYRLDSLQSFRMPTIRVYPAI